MEENRHPNFVLVRRVTGFVSVGLTDQRTGRHTTSEPDATLAMLYILPRFSTCGNRWTLSRQTTFIQETCSVVADRNNASKSSDCVGDPVPRGDYAREPEVRPDKGADHNDVITDVRPRRRDYLAKDRHFCAVRTEVGQ
jgi:hypothetical protein